MADLESRVRLVLEELSRDTREFSIGNHVSVEHGGVEPVAFLRDYVGLSKPVLVRQDAGVLAWPAHSLWSDDEYMVSYVGDVEVTVALTPDGLADCPVSDGSFALPKYTRMPFREFWHLLNGCIGKGIVPYLQQQNSSLTEEVPELLRDVPGGIAWAENSFGKEPEAINLWVGGRPSRTSWHRDHFENIYVVLRGSKTVRLLPPIDSFRMKLKQYEQLSYDYDDDDDGKLVLVPAQGNTTIKDEDNDDVRSERVHKEEEKHTVSWSSILPCSCLEAPGTRSLCSSCLELDNTGMMPLEVRVDKGDVLYIPACWWHEIHHTSDDVTIAVNYWYDMTHDVKFASMTAVDTLSEILHMNESRHV